MYQEILAFILSSSGWVLVSSTLPTDYWKVSSLDGTVITTATYWSNLWKTCVTDSTGVSNCKDFPSMLALDGQPLLSRFATVVLWPQIDFSPLQDSSLGCWSIYSFIAAFLGSTVSIDTSVSQSPEPHPPGINPLPPTVSMFSFSSLSLKAVLEIYC